ncbi:MAG: baseplate J/gp47 family protein [Anaerolineales bacterium]|nr:baseplate J/gp47 family protein [Anaerolineales bacterium]
MKTYILQLDSHDDLISTRDKMGWCKGGRILLVWPESDHILHRRLDLLLLKRHGLSLGAQLALVSRHPDVRYHAPRLGIPVFKNLAQAQSAHWRVPHRFRRYQDEPGAASTNIGPPAQSSLHKPGDIPPRPETRPANLHVLVRLAFFTLGVAALLSIAAILVPSASLTIAPKVEQQDITLQVQAGPQITAVDVVSGLVPAHLITATVEGRGAIPVSGVIEISDHPSTGQVLFTNLTDQPILIPEGTIVRSIAQDAPRFMTTQASTIPPGAGESLLLPVRCLLPGSQGNVPAESLIAIEGLLGTQLSATNPQPTRYGSDRLEPAPSAADNRQLAAQLRQSLEKTALQEMQSLLAEQDILLTSSLELSRVIEESFQPSTAQPAGQLSLNMRIEYQAAVIYARDLQLLAQSVLDMNTPPGFTPLADTVRIDHHTAPAVDEDAIASWQMTAHRQISAQVSIPRVIQLCLGMPPDQASQRLSNALPLKGTPEIMMLPSWWPRMPILPFRIRVLVSET